MNNANYIRTCLLKNEIYSNPCELNQHLIEGDIVDLLREVREIFMCEPMLLEIKTPIHVCGDIHGQYLDLLEIFRLLGNPEDKKFIFLGDYVDRGIQSLECICLLFSYKVLHPGHIHLLRGNHEESSMNKIYGFYDECKKSVGLWKCFIDVFNCMPVAAVLSKKVFCCHGGLSPHLEDLDQIRKIERPLSVPVNGLMCDLLWADPNTDCPSQDWAPNTDRGTSYIFGSNSVEKFLKKFNFQMIIRAHEVVEKGYEFFAKKGLVTVFSAPLYTNQFNNDSAILYIDSNLACQFIIFRPKQEC